MKKIRLKVLFSLLVMVLFILSGCEVVNGYLTTETGNLNITLNQIEMTSRTIVPDISMEIVSYDISGTSYSESFSEVNVMNSTLTKESLSIGLWTISVTGKNAAGTVIASGTTDVNVMANQTAIANITVTPLVGSGLFELNLSWPLGELSSPGITAFVVPESGESAIDLSLTIIDNTATYSGTLEAGYYMFTVQLMDGENVVWGRTEALRVIYNETSSAEYVIENLNIIEAGDIQVNITEDLMNPLDIELTGVESSISTGTDMTLSAFCSDTPDSYQWYLNGSALAGETSSTITIGSSLAAGYYTLDLFVTKGNVYSSEGFSFSVMNTVELNVLMHNLSWGSENSWEIQDSLGTVVASGDSYVSNTDYNTTINLTPGNYTLYGADSANDGWHGGYLTITKDSDILVDQFTVSGSSGSLTFTVSELQISGTVLIDFEDVSVGSSFSGLAALTDQYSNLNVLFAGPSEGSGGAIIHEDGNFSVTNYSSVNFLAFNTSSSLSNGSVPTGPETMTFLQPVHSLSLKLGHNSAETITLTASNSSGTTVDTYSFTGSSALEEVTLTGGNMSTVTIEFTGSILVVDDLTINFQ